MNSSLVLVWPSLCSKALFNSRSDLIDSKTEVPQAWSFATSSKVYTLCCEGFFRERCDTASSNVFVLSTDFVSSYSGSRRWPPADGTDLCTSKRGGSLMLTLSGSTGDRILELAASIVSCGVVVFVNNFSIKRCYFGSSTLYAPAAATGTGAYLRFSRVSSFNLSLIKPVCS